MLKAKQSLEQYLAELCDRIVLDNDRCKKIYNYANKTYKIPKGLVSDLIAKRMEMSEVSEFVLFILLDSICNVEKDNKNIQTVDKFYTFQETKFYRTSEYEIKKIKFPLVFKMIQVADDQWIGKIDVKTLMELRQAQLISYDANTQRVLQRIVKGDKEVYKISLNQKAIGEIKESFEKGNFISNTITLNIPLESESDFYYDKDKNSFVIKSLDSFSILDGYHRYIAASQISDINSDFNYIMELRITNWDDTKSKTFIWQDNKKTFMKRVDRESYNLNNEANIIVERLNRSILCNMKGLINRNQTIINFGEMAMLVDWFYIKNNKKKGSSNVTQLEVIKELTENINLLTEQKMDLLENKWDYKYLLSVMCVFDYCKNNDFDKRNMASLIDKVYKELNNSNNNKFKNRTPRKVLIEYVNEIIEKNV
jgi:hypothetical protein